MSNYDDNFLKHFEAELQSLDEAFDSFARKFPRTVANGQFSRTSTDPHVRLILDSFSFLHARMAVRVEEQKALVPAAILEELSPTLIECFPSTCFVKFSPDVEKPIGSGGFNLARNTRLVAEPGNNKQYFFQTVYDTLILPISASELFRESPIEKAFFNKEVRSVIGFNLSGVGCNIDQISAPTFRFFIDAPFRTAGKLREFLLSKVLKLVFYNETTGETVQLGSESIKSVGMDESEFFASYKYQAHPSFELLKDYSAEPRKFLYFEIDNPKQQSSDNKLTCLFGFGDALPSWFDVTNISLIPNVVPVINRFKKQAEPIRLNDRKVEFEVNPGNQNDNHFQVNSIDKVYYTAPGLAEAEEIYSFFAHSGVDHEEDLNKYWFAKYSYDPSKGQSCNLSLVDGRLQGSESDGHILVPTIICSNPNASTDVMVGQFLKADFELPCPARVMTQLTEEIDRCYDDEILWRLVSQMKAAYGSLDQFKDGVKNAENFSNLCSAYVPSNKKEVLNELKAINSLNFDKVSRRVGNSFSFAEGLKASMLLDEKAFVESNFYLFCEILNQMLSMFVSCNSFVELHSSGTGDGEDWLKWEIGLGGKEII
jgi:type VI secretion system protein ImpG